MIKNKLQKKLENDSEAVKKESRQSEKDKTIQDIYKHEMIPYQRHDSQSSLKVIILAVIVGMISGLVGGIIESVYLSDYYNINTNTSPSVNTNTNKQVLDLDFLVRDDDKAYDKVLAEFRNQMIGFYKQKEVEGILDSLYLENDFLGSGMVVTSDGWILTHKNVVTQAFVAVTNDKRILEPQQIIEDPFSGIVLIKVDAVNLSPVRFAEDVALKPTLPLLVARYSIQNHGSDIFKTNVQKYRYHDQVKSTDFLLSTDSIDHYLKISNQLETVYNGSVLLNDNNEVVGLIFASGKNFVNLAIPSYYLKSAVSNFLVNSGEIIRPSLGVSYIALSETLGLPDNVTENQAKGAVLLGNTAENILAVEKESPAEEAGLSAGDIILSVNNEEINERNSLTKLIQDYTPGQEITLTVLKKGEQRQVKVILGEL